MSTLQLSLLVIGLVVVAGVYLYNAYQERQMRRKMDAAFSKHGDALLEPHAAEPGHRNEPVWSGDDPSPQVAAEAASESRLDDSAAAAPDSNRAPAADAPDPYIECIVALSEVHIPQDTLRRLFSLTFGKPVRWLGRDVDGWHVLKPDLDYAEAAACMLLSSRAGPADTDQINQFYSLMREAAGSLWGQPALPALEAEVDRALDLDRTCADLDIQVGLNLVRRDQPITGTRLRGVVEASGFRLNGQGQFEYVDKDTGELLFSLTDLDPRPLTAESLQHLQTSGVTLVLDVPRVADPVHAFDIMRSVAGSLAPLLDASLRDDTREPLSDAAFDAIHARIQQTAAELRGSSMEAGGRRALRLFS